MPATVQASAAVPMKFELFNHSRRALNVLMWATPMEGFFAPYLSITGPDGELEYGGAMMKRGSPERADYARIKPGGTLMKTVNLAEIYQFNRQGRYTVKFVGKLVDVTTEKIPRPLEQHVAVAINCPDVTFDLIVKN
jgi:peptidyl-Lys metalloendopeptidase